MTRRRGRLLYTPAISAKTGGPMRVVCERCKREQPHVVNEDARRRLVGCLACGHEIGRYA